MAFPTNSTGGGVSAQAIAPNLSQHARGIGVVFEVEFFDDAPTNTMPAVPANPATDPRWTITDPSGVEIVSGVGTPGAAPGRWNASWSVPSDAPLSTQSSKWYITWNMNSQTNRALQERFPFDVVELRTPDTLEDVRAHSYMVYVGNSERLVLRLPRNADEVSVDIYPSTSLSNICPEDTAVFSGSLAGGEITLVEEQNLFAYIADTPALTVPGEYQVIWTTRQTITSPTETVGQMISVPPRVFWSLAPSLRTMIDKLQKKQGTVHAYTESDIFEYFQRGLGILNGVTPVTDWGLDTFPYASTTTSFLMYAAALWAMNAQQLLDGELQFSFSGQTITLDLDHTSLYSEVAQRLIDTLTGDGKGSWPSTKVDIGRQSQPIAVVGNRTMGRYGTWQYTQKMWSTRVGPNSPTIFDQFPGPGANAGFSLTDALVYLNLL